MQNWIPKIEKDKDGKEVDKGNWGQAYAAGSEGEPACPSDFHANCPCGALPMVQLPKPGPVSMGPGCITHNQAGGGIVDPENPGDFKKRHAPGEYGCQKGTIHLIYIVDCRE